MELQYSIKSNDSLQYKRVDFFCDQTKNQHPTLEVFMGSICSFMRANYKPQRYQADKGSFLKHGPDIFQILRLCSCLEATGHHSNPVPPDLIAACETIDRLSFKIWKIHTHKHNFLSTMKTLTLEIAMRPHHHLFLKKMLLFIGDILINYYL